MNTKYIRVFIEPVYLLVTWQWNSLKQTCKCIIEEHIIFERNKYKIDKIQILEIDPDRSL